jgi:hypothetical protein
MVTAIAPRRIRPTFVRGALAHTLLLRDLLASFEGADSRLTAIVDSARANAVAALPPAPARLMRRRRRQRAWVRLAYAQSAIDDLCVFDRVCRGLEGAAWD